MINTEYYLSPVLDALNKQYPENQTVNIVCHGHSVPAGYFATPYVNSLEAYPHILFKQIKPHFPFAVINVITSAVGGENSSQGIKRFYRETLQYNPAVITIDYALNDRQIGLEEARTAWSEMIEQALKRNIKVILVTPSWDISYLLQNEKWLALVAHSDQIRELAAQYDVGLADAFLRFQQCIKKPEDLDLLLSYENHPNLAGHEIIASEISKYFLINEKN